MTIARPRVNDNYAYVNSLKAELADVKRENARLEAENRRLTGNSGAGVHTRKCVHCARSLPDGPAYFPGYLEPMADNSAAELQRYRCIYCR